MSEPLAEGAPAQGEPPREDHPTSEPADTAGATQDTSASGPTRPRRRRGSRGGRNRSRPRTNSTDASGAAAPDGALDGADDDRPELPERPSEGRPSVEAAERALVRKPQIGDSRPAPAAPDKPAAGDGTGNSSTSGTGDPGTGAKRRRRRGGRGRGSGSSPRTTTPVRPVLTDEVPIELDDEILETRRGRERKGRPVGRYLMCVHVQHSVAENPESGRVAQIAVLEGRALIEHYVSRPADDVFQIHGNIYLGKVQNVLPGMEAAFVDIGTPKNAVLYRGDVQYDPEDVEERTSQPRIEQLLRAKQTILCQVTKNPIGAKGARLTQEVSLPGRFVVLIPNSSTYGISKRLPDDERKRLRTILDKVKPKEHGVIVRTAAERVTSEEIERDVLRLLRQWEQIDTMAKRSQAPALLYREPDMAVRVIREEFNREYRGVVIDDQQLYEEVRDYVTSISPALADRVEYYDPSSEPLPAFERFHVHEQLHKGLDRKVWLPSGGSLIIEHTEALTVIDVNTGKNVGTSSLEETVFRNNLEAAVEVARQLRLRDIGGIIVVDFIDMEIRENREEVIKVFRDALARDKTRTQVFDISELGLVEMTRKRIGEGLLESFSHLCPHCEGRGVQFDVDLLADD
ncbi:MAG TPA: Rne/Rng family ribonuclease [Acidimicrobiales bacterium]|jgi:ribonuclease E|nr:Rne/Rng family ribonuclease [Acidimicrobiales bacterium]